MPRRHHQAIREVPGEDDRGMRHAQPDEWECPAAQVRPAEDDWESLWLDLGGEG